MYFKLAYVAKLSIIINTGYTASAYNENIDKQLAQLIYETFSYKIFVYQKIKLLQKFYATKIWHYYVRYHMHPL